MNLKKTIEKEELHSIFVELNSLLSKVSLGENLNFKDSTLKGQFYCVVKDIKMKYFIGNCDEHPPSPLDSIFQNGKTLYPVNIYSHTVKTTKIPEYFHNVLQVSEKLFIDFVNSKNMYFYGLD